MPQVLKVPQAAQQQLARLVKSKAAAANAGDMKAVRAADVQIRLLRLRFGLTGRHGNTVRVKPPPRVQQVAKERRTAEARAIGKLQVPQWFQPGYRDIQRVRSWRQISPEYRKFLSKAHAAGKLDVYQPALAYLANQHRVSRYFKRNLRQEARKIAANANANGNGNGNGNGNAANTNVASDYDQVNVAETVITSTPNDTVTIVAEPGQTPEGSVGPTETDNVQEAELADSTVEAAAEVMDEAQALAAEAEDEQGPPPEPVGEGILAGESPWYNDPTKLLIAGVGALIVLSALKD